MSACLCERPRSQTRMNGPRTWRARWRRKRNPCGPRMFIPGYSANARVICRRRGDMIRAPIPETFSCERARTASRGVVPHGAHVRRRTGIIKKPVSSRQIRWAPRRRSFFYVGPVHPNPFAHSLIIALLGPRLRSLRTEATRPEESPDVIRMVGDVEMVTDEVDDPSTRPQIRAIPGRFRPSDHQARQSLLLLCRQLRRAPRCPARAQARAALASMRPLPSADRTPLDTQALGYDMNGKLALEQFDRAKSSPLELSRAPLWAHAAPPTGEYSRPGHYLGSNQ